MRRTLSAWRSSSRAVAAVAAIACMTATGSLTSSALAGRYHVYSCRTPSGIVAPTDGWTGSVTGAYDYDLNTCAEGGALVAGLGANVSHAANTDRALWAFVAPAGETIADATLMRAGDADGGSVSGVSYFFWLAGPSDNADSADIFDQCVYFSGCLGEGDESDPMSSANQVSVASSHLGSAIYLNASCGGESGHSCPAGGGDSHGYAAVIDLFAADFVLEDPTSPTVSAVGGGLAESPAVSGTTDVEFDASDAGSGVYQVSFAIDGQVVKSAVLNSNYGRCEDVGQTNDGLPAFLYTRPCPASESVDVPFDTTGLSNGTHQIVVSVSDAAGNSAVVLARKIAVENGHSASSPGASGPNAGSSVSNTGAAALSASALSSFGGPANGVNASEAAVLTARWATTARVHLVSVYGRSQTITGRLTDVQGRPIAGAVLDLSETPSYGGATPAVITGPRTGPHGGFVVHLPRGISSRTLRFAYRSHLGAPLPVATRTLTLSVHAGVALQVAPRIASAGRTISFTGVLRGGPIPHGGKQLVLEARSPGSSWIQFHVIRAGANGRFRSSYRFRLGGPVDYRFRVVSTYEPDFPFLAGHSNLVKVYER